MADPSTPIPDAIEPITAYRAWIYSVEGPEARLYPLAGSASWMMRGAWDGAGDSWVTASCPRLGSSLHKVPSEGCSCGFYSLKALDLAWCNAAMLHRFGAVRSSPARIVLGRVLLAGKVIEHDLGYRSERARIAELIPIRGTEPSITVLADRLGVGIAHVVEPLGREEVLRPLASRPRPSSNSMRTSSDYQFSAVLGFLAVAALTVCFALLIAGVWQEPPIGVIVVSVLWIGRSAESMGQALSRARGRPGDEPRRPRRTIGWIPR